MDKNIFSPGEIMVILANNTFFLEWAFEGIRKQHDDRGIEVFRGEENYFIESLTERLRHIRKRSILLAMWQDSRVKVTRSRPKNSNPCKDCLYQVIQSLDRNAYALLSAEVKTSEVFLILGYVNASLITRNKKASLDAIPEYLRSIADCILSVWKKNDISTGYTISTLKNINGAVRGDVPVP